MLCDSILWHGLFRFYISVYPLSYFCVLTVQGDRLALFKSESLINCVNPKAELVLDDKGTYIVTK